MGKTIGIDLGTTNSCVAVMEDDRPTVIHNREGKRTTPSIVAFADEGSRLVGISAKRQAVTNPAHTLGGVKRLIGRKFDSDAVRRMCSTRPYEIVASSNGDAWIRVGDRDYSPQEISAFILEDLKEVAEAYIGEEASEAVITVPAYFDDSQRQATRDAGKLAGLKVKRIINEPTAAALAYGIKEQEDKRIAVFDLGGGTFDISILEMAGGVFEVLATSGDTLLGGDDVDRRLVEYLLADFEATNLIDLADDATALQRVREAVEEAKHELSVAMETNINLPFIAQKEGQPLHLMYDISRRTFESLISTELDRLESPCREALEQAGVSADEIDHVLLVGGMTRMPAVEERVEQIFGKKPAKGVNPDEVVALGAAIQSSVMDGVSEEVVLLDVVPHSVGIRVKGGNVSRLIERNSRIPCRAKKIFTPVEQGQDFVVIEVFQGEANKVAEGKFLGRFTLEDLGNGGPGNVNVEVSFTIDANGVLDVSASDLASGKQASVKIQPAGGLSAKQMDQIIEEKRRLPA